MKTKLLNQITLNLLPEDHQTHKTISLYLDKSYQVLEIDFSYGPQEIPKSQAVVVIRQALELYEEKEANPYDFLPLVNLITLSLDYDGKYIGCRHNKEPNQKISISENVSSLGYISHDVLAGKWNIQLNLHCLLSPVTLQLKVKVIED